MAYSSQELDSVYHALANSTRRKILTRLCRETCTVTELAEPFNMSLAAVSKHIKVLERAGLLKKQREAATFRCEISFEPIKAASALVHYLEKFLPEEKPEESVSEAINKAVQEMVAA